MVRKVEKWREEGVEAFFLVLLYIIETFLFSFSIIKLKNCFHSFHLHYKYYNIIKILHYNKCKKKVEAKVETFKKKSGGKKCIHTFRQLTQIN